jgi:TorA maturation chaperone TorD
VTSAEVHTAAPPLLAALRQALADDVALLARLHDREPDAALIEALRSQPVEHWFALRLDGPTFDEGRRLMETALAALPEPLDRPSLDDLAAEFAAIYLTYGYRAAPAESVWVDADGLERQDAMFAVRAWYRRFGVRVPDWRRRSDDHLVHQLQLVELALRDDGNTEAVTMMAAFLREHLMGWSPQFVTRVVSRCRLPFFAAAALLTAAWLERFRLLAEAATGEDITPVAGSTALGRGAGRAAEPTCGTPPTTYVPGAGPGW